MTVNDYEGPHLISSGNEGNALFGTLVKHLRHINEWDVKDLAPVVGVHESFIRGIERGTQAPSMKTAKSLLGAMKNNYGITWTKSDKPYDLLIADHETGKNIAFIFKAHIKGQNQRPKVVSTADINTMKTAMRDIQLRLECLSLAQTTSNLPETVVRAAIRYEQYVRNGD